MSLPGLGRLLIVDDEVKLMTALCEMLGEYGYETAGFASAQAALEALRGQDFDLLLTDLMMPEMDGIALLRAALDIDPNLISIIMTGQGTIQTAVETMKIGAFDYLLKPFKLRAVLPTLSRAMQVRRLRVENIQLQETVGIYGLSMAIAFALDVNTILSKVADAAVQQFGADEASILLPTPTGNELYIAVARGERPRPILGERVPIEGSIAGWVLRQHQPLTLDGEVKDSRFAPLIPRPEIRAAVSMPMVMGGELVGVLNINSKHGRGFRLGQVKALNILATIAASALKNAQLYDQVREAEEKYRSLFENAAEGIFRTTPEGRYVAANPALARMLGYDSPEELMAAVTDIGQQLYVNPDRRREFRRLLETQSVLRGFEAQLYRKDGSTVWVSEHVRAVRDAGGALRSYEGICEDITDRKRAEEELRRHVERLKGLREIDQAILVARSPQAIAEAALQRIRRLVPCQRASVALFDFAAKEGTVLAANADGDTSVGAGTRLPLDDFLIAQSLRQGKVHMVEDTRNLPTPPPVVQALQSEGIRAFVSVPLVVQGTLIGALYLGAGRPGAFPAESVDIASEVADQLAVAIQQARLHTATERAAREARSLYEVAQSLTTSLDPAEVLHLISVKTTELLCTPHAQVTLWDEATQTLQIAAAYGTEAEKVKGRQFHLGEGVNGIVAQTRAPLIVNDYQAFPHRVKALHELVADIAVPLLYRGQFLGVLNSHATEPGSAFTQDHLNLLSSFAAQAAIAIENARLYEKLRQAAFQLEAKVEERTRELQAANEQLAAASRHKSEFLANMSHELRTPLNSVIGFAELLQGQSAGPLTEKQVRYLGHIHNSGKHLLQLISDILDLAKVEAGKFVLQPEALPVATTLEDILVLVRGLANKKQQELSAEIEATLPPLRADPVRFKQILFNLLSNAVKFTPESGTVRVTARPVDWSNSQMVDSSGPVDQLTTRPIDAPGVWLEIRVTDTGIGIKADDLPRLFQEFVQLEATASKRHEGTGLGLALTKRLVEMHGGRIWAESEGEGKGSTFTVVLPFDGPRT